MSSRRLAHDGSSSSRTPGGAAATTPVKRCQEADDQYAGCPYGSPISGLCTASTTLLQAAGITSSAKARLRLDTTPSSSKSPGLAAAHAKGASHVTSSMPELWQGPASWAGPAGGGTSSTTSAAAQQLRLSAAADNRPRRDQGSAASSLQQPGLSSSSSSHNSGGRLAVLQQAHADVDAADGAAGQGGERLAQQQPLLPLHVLLSPLLPSADEAKLVDRLSQLRLALDEHVRLAGGWEQQAVTMQQALAEAQDEALVLRGQVASQQHHITLLGGNLQGRLSLVQGAVLAELQDAVSQKDGALAASTQHVLAIQAELERLSCGYASKLAAEQAERQRLSAETAQARLLCTARGRQVASLQQELQQLKDAAVQQQQTADAARELHQQQLEGMLQRLQEAEKQVLAAQHEAVEAHQSAAAAEGGSSGLQQQLADLQALLADRQLQIEWLEGKLTDLEGTDISQQVRRHQSEMARLQETSAADRRALEQQLAAAQQQVAELQQQQQDQGWQQQAEQLQQQVQDLQQQLAQQQDASQDLQQQLAREQQQSADVQAELVQQLTAADAELQQLREQLDEADGETAVLTQQLHQQARQPGGGYDRAAAPSAADDDADGSGSPHAPAAVVHALRAELGIANAEVARLRHQLDVAQASQQQERELTGHEILRLQQELSDASSPAGSAAASGGCAGAVAGVASPAASPAGAGEVTSRQRGARRFGSDSTSSWHSVHDNPAFEQAQRQALADALASGADDVDAADAAAAVSRMSRYEEKLQDQADTISSLQRQLKQQEQLLATMQRGERRVFDSAASKGSWADAVGIDDHHQQQHLPSPLNPAWSAAAAGHAVVLEPATPHADAAVQTDLSGPAESAGSTAAAATAPADTASEGHHGQEAGWPVQQQQHRHDQHASSRHQQQPVAADAGDAAASTALLAAARHEILRLQQLNHQVMQAHAEELKVSVSFEDARRAVGEAKQHAKAKAASVLQANNKAWADKLAAARAEAQQLQEQLRDLQQQRDQLASEASSMCQAHSAAVLQLEQELSAARQHAAALQRQLQHMADNHLQELEQVRMEVEADAAAAMLDAAAASNKLEQQEQQQQQQQEQRSEVCDATAQTEPEPAAGSGQAQEAAVQTDSPADSLQDAPVQQPHTGSAAASGQQQQAAGATSNTPSPAAADGRPCTPSQPAAGPSAGQPLPPQQPAAVDALAAGVTAAAAGVQTPQRQRLVASWRSAAAAVGGAAELADDDICRFSSASDTPASASSRGPVSRFRASAYAPGAPDTNSQRPGSAGAATNTLPELTATSSPIAPGAVKAASLHGQRAAQQQQQQRDQQEQQQQQLAEKGSAQMSSWHAELLQQQVELEGLKARLSQQQQQQQQARAGSGGGSTSRGSPAVAHSRTLLLAPFVPSLGAAAGDGSRGVDSPAGPLVSSSSPLTYQQRRAAAQQAAAATVAAEGRGSGTLYSQQSGATAAEQQQQPGRAAAGLDAPPRWRSCSPDAFTNSLLFGSPQACLASAGAAADGAAASGGGSMQRSSGWGLSLTAAAAVSAAARQQQQAGAAPSPSAYSPAGSSALGPAADTSAGGLSRLGDDVLGALSLSRYHRERSKLQEARAKQHALLASHHEDQAAALRNSRLGGSQSPASFGGGGRPC